MTGAGHTHTRSDHKQRPRPAQHRSQRQLISKPCSGHPSMSAKCNLEKKSFSQMLLSRGFSSLKPISGIISGNARGCQKCLNFQSKSTSKRILPEMCVGLILIVQNARIPEMWVKFAILLCKTTKNVSGSHLAIFLKLVPFRASPMRSLKHLVRAARARVRQGSAVTSVSKIREPSELNRTESLKII